MQAPMLRGRADRSLLIPVTRPSDLVRHSDGHYRRSRMHLLHRNQPDPDAPTSQSRMLAWLRDHIHPSVPRRYYHLVLGHDLHISTYARLYLKHFHYSQPDPFTGRVEFNPEVYRWLSQPDDHGNVDIARANRLAHGWLEDVGLVSQGKVTTAFRDFEIDQLIAESSAYGDFKYHEVGTDATAESNAQTALITSTGIARVAGTQVEVSAAVYRTVATITADTTETWQEHGVFNASTVGVLSDRGLMSPTAAVVANDTVQTTFELTKAAEA